MDYIPQADATNGYPTRDGFFPRISLFESDLASLRAEAASAVNKTLEKFLEWRQEKRAYPVECPPWKLYNEHRGLYQYKRLYERHPNIVGSRIFGAIEGNYRDVARFFKTETREEYFNAQKILFPSTVDAAVLHTFPPREGEGSLLSSEGIKWVACDPFLLRFRMDSCHYETMGEGVDPDGKPGPGGAGAVILATDADAVTARIVWSASVSYASCTTTNNQAEYLGLITGLAAAETHRWRMDVVGDSALILGQMRSYRPPRHPTLRPLYAEARRLADRVRVRTWTHHLRAYNKMADLAANIAMDTRRSVQGLHIQPREHHSRLEAHLATDFHEWQSRHLRHDSSG